MRKPCEFLLGDVHDASGKAMPDIELATASFPCNDLSLAGSRVIHERARERHAHEQAEYLKNSKHAKIKSAKVVAANHAAKRPWVRQAASQFAGAWRTVRHSDCYHVTTGFLWMNPISAVQFRVPSKAKAVRMIFKTARAKSTFLKAAKTQAISLPDKVYTFSAGPLAIQAGPYFPSPIIVFCFPGADSACTWASKMEMQWK